MHNNIMAAGSKDRPPMLGPGRYSQWRSRFLRYIDTKPNGEGLRKSILSGPYVPSTVLVQAVAATEGNPAIQQHTTIETVLNMTPENKEHFLSEKEAIFLLLTGIGDDIYSTVDACKTANEMWIAIERLQQDGESMESYYSRFYKLMNELTRNNLQVTTMQVNVQFLQQLQPEWSRFVTVVKQSKEIDTISYHTLFDILKQYQNEVNDIRAERIAKSANPLALLVAAQPYSDNYYQAPKPQRSNATSSSTRPSASTKHKGKEITKPVTPQSELVSEEDSDPEQAQRDKDMQKNLALLAKYFKRLYKPTNNNLRTSSNSRNKTEDTTLRYNSDNQSRQFGNQRTMTVAGTRETVGSPVVQQTGIQCFNCKGFSHYAKECRKPKRVKDYSYHKEKMMMCKQAEHGVPLQADQADWLADTDEEIDEQELEAYYNFMAKIQEVLPEESSSTEQPLEQVQNNDENNVFANERQHSKNNTAECADERATLANLIANLKLEECKTNLDETSRALREATSCQDSSLIALQNKQNELEKYIAFNDRTIDYDILQTKLNETLGLLARKDIDIKEGLKTKAYEILVVNQKHDELVKRSLLTKSQFEGQHKEKSKVISDLKVKEEKDIDKMIEMDKQLKFLNEIVYTRNQSIQTIHMLAPKCSTYNGRPTFANPRYLKKAQSEKPCLYEIPYDTSDLANRFGPNREETMTLANESRSKLNKDYVKPYDYTKQNSLYEIFKAPSLEYLYQLERAKEVRKTMWRKPFVRTKPNIAKNVAFLPVSKSISKSRQVFNDMTFNINHFRTICEQAWSNHTSSYFRVPTAQDMEVLIKTLLMPLSIKSQNDSFRFEHELKTEMQMHDLSTKAKKSAQLLKEKMLTGKPSMIDPVILPNTANGTKPFLKFNDLGCPTCKKCLYSANHDECVLEYLSRLNPRASAQNKDAKSHKTTKRYMPVEKSSASKKPERQIPTGHRFSNKKTTTVPEKTMNPRSCLRWQLTGRILKTVGLRWVPTGKLFNSCISKVESEPTHGSNVDIHHIHACKQTLGLSAGKPFNGQKQQRINLNADALYNAKQENLRVWLLKMLISKKPAPFLNVQMTYVHISSGLILHQMTSDHNRSELGIQDHSNEQFKSKLVPKVVP
ncbi:retrovirus-related pol polyprotein from transposon TNT 1-94 [Tanacetum coccineum]